MLALEFNEIVVATFITVGVLTAHTWAGRVDGAAALYQMKESTDRAIHFIFLVLQDALRAFIGFVHPCEFFLGISDGQIEVFC